MTSRTTRSVVRFSSAFLLSGFDAPQPAGDYRVEQDEEMIEGISWLAYRRVAAFIHLPAIAVAALAEQVVQIDLADLDAALEQDRRQA